MNKICRFPFYMAYLCLFALFLFSDCTHQVVSGTEVGNPPTVSGRVYDMQDNIVANAAVFLVAPDYNPVLDTIASFELIGYDTTLSGILVTSDKVQRMATRTDDEGLFVLDSVIPQAYNLFITDISGSRVNFTSGITIDESNVDLGRCEVRDIGHASILIADSVFTSNGYISVPGTPVKKTVDAAGQYTVPVISDSMTVNYYDISGDSLSSILHNQSIPPVNPGDTINLTGIETVLIPPVLAAIIGNDTLYPPIDTVETDDSLIFIAAFGATINISSEIEYQFYETTGNTLAEWGTDSIFPLEIISGSHYSVACRIRSGANSTDVTGWTTGLSIRIKQPDGSSVLPAPLPPVAMDTLTFTDSTLYSFLVKDSIDDPDSLRSYRIQWSDTVENSGFSQWSRDSVFYVSFPSWGLYEIRAQARSVEDTSQMSLWSGSLLFTVSP